MKKKIHGLNIINLSDIDLQKRFAWKKKCFKDPFLGFEEQLELRDFRILVDSYKKPKIEKPIILDETDFKISDFVHFLQVKNKIYSGFIRTITKRRVSEYEVPFLRKKDQNFLYKRDLFIRMYLNAIKKEKSQQDVEIFFIEKDNPSEKSGEDEEEQEDRSLWTLNKRTISDIKQNLHRPANEILSLLFEDSSYKQEETNLKEMDFWSEHNIPYFFLNFNTGSLDYDFWNNSDERLQKRKRSLKLFKAGKKTWEEIKAEQLKITLPRLRGLFGPEDRVLLRQPSFDDSSKIQHYLPYYTKIYNWFQNPASAVSYSKLMFGLVGPSLIPHWCLLFTMTKTRKNVYFTVTDMAGKVLLTLSAGSFNIHRKKRLSPHALEPLFQKVLECFKKLKVKNVILIMKFKAKYMHLHTFNFFKKNRIAVKVVIDKLPIPHNGIRSRKQKRL